MNKFLFALVATVALAMPGMAFASLHFPSVGLTAKEDGSLCTTSTQPPCEMIYLTPNGTRYPTFNPLTRTDGCWQRYANGWNNYCYAFSYNWFYDYTTSYTQAS